MDDPVPWARLEARIAPTHPKGGGKGRQPHPLPVMLRVHCVQPFCGLSDPAMEDLLCEAESVRRFAGVSPEKVPTRRRSRLPLPAGAAAVREIGDRLAGTDSAISRFRGGLSGKIHVIVGASDLPACMPLLQVAQAGETKLRPSGL